MLFHGPRVSRAVSGCDGGEVRWGGCDKILRLQDTRPAVGREEGGGRPHPAWLCTSSNDTYLGKFFFVNPGLNDNLVSTLDFPMKQLTTPSIKITFIITPCCYLIPPPTIHPIQTHSRTNTVTVYMATCRIKIRGQINSFNKKTRACFSSGTTTCFPSYFQNKDSFLSRVTVWCCDLTNLFFLI